MMFVYFLFLWRFCKFEKYQRAILQLSSPNYVAYYVAVLIMYFALFNSPW